MVDTAQTASPMDQDPSNPITRDVGAIFDNGRVDMSHIFVDPTPTGTGTENNDNFLASLLTLPQMKGPLRDDPNRLNSTDLFTRSIGMNQDQISDTPRDALQGRIQDISSNVLNQTLNNYVRAMQNVYASTPHPEVIADAKQNVKTMQDALKTADPTKQLAASFAYTMGKFPNRNTVERLGVIAKASVFNAYVDQHLSHGFGRSAKEFVSSMFVPSTIRDLAGGLTPAKLVLMAKEFRNKLPEEQIKDLPEILDYLAGVSDNKHIFETNAQPFLDSEDINSVWRSLGLDIIGVASILPLAKFAKLAGLSTTAIRMTREAEALDASGTLAAEALADTTGKAAAIAGTDRVTAAASSLPFGGEAAMPNITNGINVAAQAKLESWLGPVRQLLNRIISGANKNYILRGAMLPQERDAFQEKLLSTYAGQAKIISQDENGMLLRVVMEQASEDGATFTPIEHKFIRYRANDIGTFDALEYRVANQFSSSADTVMNQLVAGHPVAIASTIEYTQKHILGMFQAAGKEVFQGMSRAERKQINSLLEHGEQMGVNRFQTADLLAGVQTKDGVIRLGNAEQVARYHTARDMMDAHFYLNNQILHRELLFNGYDAALSMKNYLGNMTNFIKRGKGLSELPSGMREIYDMRVGKVVPITDRQAINDALKSGKLQLHETHFKVEYARGHKVDHVLATNFHVRALPDQVLNKVPGYFGPLMYKNIFHVVMEDVEDHLNGIPIPGKKVDRAFSSMEEAKRYLALPENKGKEGKLRIYNSKEFSDSAGTLPKDVKDDFQTKMFNGFTTSQRDPEKLKFGLAGTTAETASAIESMEAAIGNVSERLPMNDFRMGMINRLVNSAKKFDPDKGGIGDRLSADWTADITGHGKEQDALRYAQNWMKGIFNIKTNEERGFQSLMYHVGSWLDGETMNHFTLGTTKFLHNWAMNLAGRDVYGKARTLAFHALLGWLNPRQIWVQAAGAQAAFFINPERAPALMARYMALRAGAYDDLHVTGKLIRDSIEGAMKGGPKFMPAEQWDDMMAAYRRSGVRDSIRATADYDASIKGFGMTRRMLSSAADKGLFFLRESELFNRSYNWLWAHDRFMAKKGAGYRLTIADEQHITEESLRISTNLMKANRAGFQKGFMSIPFQFQQVSSKFIGNMLYGMKNGKTVLNPFRGGQWSGPEKLKIAAGSLLMFGAADIPFGQWGLKHMVNWAQDDGDYGLGIKDKDTVHAMMGGFTDYVLDKVTDTNASISTSLSYAGNFSEMLANFTSANTTMTKAATAAFGSVGNRVWTALGDAAPLVRGDIRTGHYDMATLEQIVSTLAKPISSWRNWDKANTWQRTKLLVDEHNTQIRAIDPDANPSDAHMILLQRLGFSQQEFQDVHTLKTIEQDHDRKIRDRVDAWEKIIVMNLNNPYYETEQGKQVAEGQIGVILGGLTEAERAKVSAGLKAKIKDRKSAIAQHIGKMIDLRMETEGQLPNAELNIIEIPRDK